MQAIRRPMPGAGETTAVDEFSSGKPGPCPVSVVRNRRQEGIYVEA
jgi:hypothetical protein